MPGVYGKITSLAKSMRRQGLRAKFAKKLKATTNSKHNLLVALNRLQQDFTATAPKQKYVGDITYLWTHEGWLYLAVVIDLYSRLVVGWALSDRMTRLACDVLQVASWRRQMPSGVIVHLGRGSQYCSGAYQRLISKHGLLCSISAKGNCYDNACAEIFFHSLKVEAIHGERFATREEIRQWYSSTSKRIRIEPADTAPTVLSARQRLRQAKSLDGVSTVGGYDQNGTFEAD